MVFIDQRCTRDLILDATDRLMGEQGFRKMSVEDVAREAAVARRTIYTYFSSKEELGLASIGRVVENAITECEQIAAERIDPLARLRKVLIRRVMSRVLAVQDYHHGLDELFLVVRPVYMIRRKAFFKQERLLIAGLLQQARESGQVQFEGPETTAHCLLVATNAFLPYSLSARELGKPEEVERRLTALVDILLRGIAVSRTIGVVEIGRVRQTTE
ncbi:TetR/AcrR family transcriptional regulator [soil metagenome]